METETVPLDTPDIHTTAIDHDAIVTNSHGPEDDDGPTAEDSD